MDTFWQKQAYSNPLFEDMLWSRPEQKSLAGKLLIVGGNAHAIAAPGEAFMLADKAGAGTVKVAMPDKTKKLLGGKTPLNIELTPSTPSGSYSKDATAALQGYCAWADATLFAGDIGRNSETAIVLEQLATKMPGLQIYTRDAVDYFSHTPLSILKRNDTLLVLSIAQLQKLTQNAGFTTAITYTMGLPALCRALQALTADYGVYVVTQQGANIITAVGGQVIVTNLPQEPDVWRLKTATYASVWWLQNPKKPIEAIATAITEVIY